MYPSLKIHHNYWLSGELTENITARLDGLGLSDTFNGWMVGSGA